MQDVHTQPGGIALLDPDEWVRRLQAPDGGTPATSAAIPELLSVLQEHSRKAETILSMADEKRFFEQKCGECHSSARVFLVTLTPEQRRHVVRRMRVTAPDWISEEEARQIVDYLKSRTYPKTQF